MIQFDRVARTLAGTSRRLLAAVACASVLTAGLPGPLMAEKSVPRIAETFDTAKATRPRCARNAATS